MEGDGVLDAVFANVVEGGIDDWDGATRGRRHGVGDVVLIFFWEKGGIWSEGIGRFGRSHVGRGGRDETMERGRWDGTERFWVVQESSN